MQHGGVSSDPKYIVYLSLKIIWQFNLKNKECDSVTNYGCGPQQNYVMTVVKYCTKWKQNTLKLFHYLKFYILLLYSETYIYTVVSVVSSGFEYQTEENLNEGT